MPYNYPFNNFINLYVKGRISQEDAARQYITAKEILKRLGEQPGLILADEVGMGKTFVALAVAISVYLKDKKPSVVMMPANLVNKWPNDFKLFCEACITDPAVRNKLRCGVATRPEEFLRLLDADKNKRAAVIFLTHGALARNMSDGWIKLAVIQRALFRRKNTENLYKSLYRYAGRLLELMFMEKGRGQEMWELLLDAKPDKWKSILVSNEFVDATWYDPIPALFSKELDKLNTEELDRLYWHLRNEMPQRESDNMVNRLRNVRKILNEEAKRIWANCLLKIKIQLPLLIFDEAHHLKNSQTQLVTKLFHDSAAIEDAGILTGKFDRMVFLTATPFQLGHHELVRVLERFSTVNWKSSQHPGLTKEDYKNELNTLLKKLDDSQLTARKLDNTWGKLTSKDIICDGAAYENVYEWWKAIQSGDTVIEHDTQKLLDAYGLAKEKLRLVEPLLKKYVIRHLKPKKLAKKSPEVLRRNNLPGNLILDSNVLNCNPPRGLEISKHSVLPFLLAARLSTIQPDKRPVFAEGLASSFEAFRFTREERLKRVQSNITDADDDVGESSQVTDEVAVWYLDQLNESLSLSVADGSQHPKIKATVDKAMKLWAEGEKVLIFCHYIATGKALRKYLSMAMRRHIRKTGMEMLQCKEEEVFDHLEKTGLRIGDKDSPMFLQCTAMLNQLIDEFPDLQQNRFDIIDIIVRYMKTPSFQVRFASSLKLDYNDKWLEQSLAKVDNSGISLLDMLKTFLIFLTNRQEDREAYIAALKSVQPGGIRVKDINFEDFEDHEVADQNDSTVMANVRLCYGATKQETRQKLMKTFNTPFFPDILITSNVMAEGVDLQLNCRHIIHHDLCWNPSTLEQRTGRIDRIGAKGEMCGKPIKVYLPYISETQDEKMYRVVTERERWFNIIMGDTYKVDAMSTDKYAERIPFPDELASELSFNLEVE
ncbi:MAG: hypothetical protein EOO46_00030 [Flavobacterium sp.]|nr:MAG: hypothetical protein EOO46_00030 [Flavobacterium sp.]